MDLASLIDEYLSCETALNDAIHDEDERTVRKLDLRMAWLRKVIRAFPAMTAEEKRVQIDFFMDAVSKATDQDRAAPPLSDLDWIMERSIERGEIRAEAVNGHPAPDSDAGRAMFHGDRPCSEVQTMIEASNLRVVVIGRDLRYRYSSPANGRFHDMPTEALHGKHIIEVIGERRFKGRARAYLERCFTGEDVSYHYFLDTPARGRLLLECQMLTQRCADDHGAGAIMIMRDLTKDCRDPVLSAEQNRV